MAFTFNNVMSHLKNEFGPICTWDYTTGADMNDSSDEEEENRLMTDCYCDFVASFV